MKILLLGKTGMLGSALDFDISAIENVVLVSLSRDVLDITDFFRVHSLIDDFRPDLVVNATGFTAVDDCEEQRELALLVNGTAVGEVARACKKVGAALLHFSTDYVFDGNNPDGYRESDLPAPINVYGESKLLGENLVSDILDRHYIVRTSWLFGPNGKNFVSTMLKLAAERSELNVVGDQIGSPTFTKDLSSAVVSNFINSDFPFGVYHLTNSGACSWFDFARKIFEISKINITITETDSSTFLRPAKRPMCSILINSKTDLLRHWTSGLFDFISFSDK